MILILLFCISVVTSALTMKYNGLKSGDILLSKNVVYDNSNLYSVFRNILTFVIRVETDTSFSHAALVIVDPPWAETPGTYAWQIEVTGPRIIPLSEFIKDNPGCTYQTYARNGTRSVQRLFTDEKLRSLHQLTSDARYDNNPNDWLAALHHTGKRHSDSFFCSAFVGYILTQCGVLAEDTNWSDISPRDLSSDSYLHWNHKYSKVYKLQ